MIVLAKKKNKKGTSLRPSIFFLNIIYLCVPPSVVKPSGAIAAIG